MQLINTVEQSTLSAFSTLYACTSDLLQVWPKSNPLRCGVIHYEGKQILESRFTWTKPNGLFIQGCKGDLSGLYLGEKEILPVDFIKILLLDRNIILAAKGEQLVEEETDLYRQYWEVYKYDSKREKATYCTSFWDIKYRNEKCWALNHFSTCARRIIEEIE